MMHYIYCKTPVGYVTIFDNGMAITAISFGRQTPQKGIYKETILSNAAQKELHEYFERKRKIFTLPLETSGTVFQQKVWAVLQDIPWGQTRSYKQVAQAAGNPRACRAVGMASHHNPIAIMIPCHRVIGASGSLVGFGGGLEIKKILLELEQD